MIALLALAGTAALLGVVTVVGMRRPSGAMPDRGGYFDRWSALHGGYDPRSSVWTREWLSVTYRCARPLARLGVAPDVLTLWGAAVSGLVVALADMGGRWPLLAIVAVVGSGLTDNLDGAVAALTGRATRFGYVLDSLVDRVSDGLYLLALYLLGAPGGLCVAAGTLAGLQEYTRARAGNVGMHEVGVVTVWERPSRVIVTAFTLLAAGLYLGHVQVAATAGAASATGLGLVGMAQLLFVVRRALAQSGRADEAGDDLRGQRDQR